MEAARTGNVAAVRALLARNANVNAAESEREQTAVDVGVSQRHPEVVKLLLDRGADLKARTAVRDG